MKIVFLASALLILAACADTTQSPNGSSSASTRPYQPSAGAKAFTSRADQLSSRDGTVCGDLSWLAASAMNMRQAGFPIAHAKEVFSILPEVSPQRKLADLYVLQAYDSPAYSTEEYQRKAIGEFANDAYVRCSKV